MSEDVNEADFIEKVLGASRDKPVIVDFWAPWCGPCRVLGPVLEAEVRALGDRVKMVKVNTDESPNLAARYNIQGIPAVKAFRNGEVASEFVGARPVPFVRSWLAALAPSPSAEAFARGTEALRTGNTTEAEAALRPLIDDPEVKNQARLALARALLSSGRPADVAALLAGIDPRHPAADSIPTLERLLAFSTDAAAGGGEDQARAKADADPKDLDARYALASALAARGDFAPALEHFLDVVTRNRKFRDEGARLGMLAIFDLLGNDHPLTQDFRRRLQIVL
jgi:putative thioredoxin